MAKTHLSGSIGTHRNKRKRHHARSTKPKLSSLEKVQQHLREKGTAEQEDLEKAQALSRYEDPLDCGSVQVWGLRRRSPSRHRARGRAEPWHGASTTAYLPVASEEGFLNGNGNELVGRNSRYYRACDLKSLHAYYLSLWRRTHCTRDMCKHATEPHSKAASPVPGNSCMLDSFCPWDWN